MKKQESITCNDDFSNFFLKTINSVYKKFALIKKQGSIYAFGYNGKGYDKPLPKEGGNLDVAYPETDVVIIDKNCIKPLTREYLEHAYAWKPEYENPDYLLGFSAGCKVFADYFKARN